MLHHATICKLRYLALLPLLCAIPRTAIAQTPAWLKLNEKSGPPRYEGLLDQPNARREYDVLAFLAFTTQPAAKPFSELPTDLHIQYCRPAESTNPKKNDAAFIEVRQLTGHVNYLMKAAQAPKADANKTSNQWITFAWPSKPVIQLNNIDPNKLGVVIHIGEDNEYAENVTPAYFSNTGGAPANIHYYTLTLRIQQNTLDSLSYRIHPVGSPDITCYYRNDLHACDALKPATQSPIETGSLVNLPINASSFSKGPVTVHVEGHYHDSDEVLTATFHFDHEPLCQ
ncbi:hypothetical protein [Acidicapsa ligni]|uniref:hypothetical protein n=1 Tax=Acidicapsa ligni TaxID=542300 RepID=UPI0021E085F0|nr:hypothetical protein [Acidicapsa ligni]